MRAQLALSIVACAVLLPGCSVIVDHFTFVDRDGGLDTPDAADGDGGQLVDAAVLDAGDGADAGPRDAGTLLPPRPLAPLSTARVTSRRPTLHWALHPEIDGARVEFCAERDCATVLETVDATGTQVRPSADLPPGVVFWRAFGRSGAAVGGVPSPVWQLHVGVRSADADADLSAGTTLDLNGDGHADVAIGAPLAGAASEGVVHIHLGGSGGVGATPLVLGGPVDEGNFGTSVASAGDVNGDGFSELVVGAASAFDAPGRVYLYPGGPGALTAPPQELTASEDGQFGWSVRGAGDVNGDGYGDLVVGDYSASTPSGAAYVYFGSVTGLDVTPVTLTNPIAREFGRSVAGAGDLNGDGFADVVVGAPGSASEDGAAYVYLGGASGLSATPISVLGPAGEGRRFGESVAAGDIDGDGFSDLIVGAMNFDGAAYLFRGSETGPSSTPTTLLGPAGVFGNFGWSVAVAGDLDGDGYDDVLLGGPRANSDEGAVVVFRGGPSEPSVASVSPLGGPSGMRGRFGTSVAAAGDIDLDGFADVIIGASGVRDSDGSGFVYFGSRGVLGSTPTELRGPLGLRGTFGAAVAGSN